MDNRHGHYNSGQEGAWAGPQLSPSAPDGNFQNPAMASYPQPTEESDFYPTQVSFVDRKTGTEYAADGTVINKTDPYLHDDRTADDVPMVDISSNEPRVGPSNDDPRLDMYEGRHPAPPLPPYGAQNQVPWIISQPPTNYVYVQQPQSNQTPVETVDVPDHYSFSLFVCLCCCWPIGLCAMNKANEARELVRQGRFAEARAVSKDAQSYSILGLLIGIVFLIISIAVAVWRVMLIQEENSDSYNGYT